MLDHKLSDSFRAKTGRPAKNRVCTIEETNKFSFIKLFLGIPIETSQCLLEPGTPGMIALREDGSLVLVPFEGYYCNVPEHHQLEDEVSALKVG